MFCRFRPILNNIDRFYLKKLRTHRRMLPVQKAVVFGIALFVSMWVVDTSFVMALSYVGSGYRLAGAILAAKSVSDYQFALASATRYVENISNDRNSQHFMADIDSDCRSESKHENITDTKCMVDLLFYCESVRTNVMYLDGFKLTLFDWNTKYGDVKKPETIPIVSNLEYSLALTFRFFANTIYDSLPFIRKNREWEKKIETIDDQNQDVTHKLFVFCKNKSWSDVYNRRLPLQHIEDVEANGMGYVKYMIDIYDFEYVKIEKKQDSEDMGFAQLFFGDSAPLLVSFISTLFYRIFRILFRFVFRTTMYAITGF